MIRSLWAGNKNRIRLFTKRQCLHRGRHTKGLERKGAGPERRSAACPSLEQSEDRAVRIPGLAPSDNSAPPEPQFPTRETTLLGLLQTQSVCN